MIGVITGSFDNGLKEANNKAGGGIQYSSLHPISSAGVSHTSKYTSRMIGEHVCEICVCPCTCACACACACACVCVCLCTPASTAHYCFEQPLITSWKLMAIKCNLAAGHL